MATGKIVVNRNRPFDFTQSLGEEPGKRQASVANRGIYLRKVQALLYLPGLSRITSTFSPAASGPSPGSMTIMQFACAAFARLPED